MKQQLKNIFVVLISAVSLIVLFAFFVTEHIWGNIYIEQILINLQGAASVVPTSLKTAYISAGLLGITFAFILARFLKNKYLIVLSLFCLAFTSFKIGLFSYLTNQKTYSQIFEREYVDPNKISYTFPSDKNNLIVLYLESMEENYAIPSDAGENLIPNISSVKANSLSFDGFYQIQNQDYTIAAIIQSMCAVPYKKTNLRGFIGFENFLQNLTCYPEILRRNGYQTYFLKGADINFARTGRFMETHGFEHVFGKKELEEKFNISLEKNTGAFSGYRDSTLYQIVKKQLSDLSTSNKPFFLSFITLDTHAPSVYLDEKCQNTGSIEQDAVRCADEMAADFLNWLKEQPFFEKTTVIVLGDHTYTGVNNIYPKLNKRRIVNFILNPVQTFKKENHFAWTTLDIAPTILNALGISFENGAFGLGRSLLMPAPTLFEQSGLKLETELSKSSEVYNGFETILTKSEPKYRFYQLSDNKLTDLEQISSYATYAHTVLGAVYLDELSFQIPKDITDDLELELTLRMMLSSKKQEVDIFINNHLQEKWFLSNKESNITSKTVHIPSNLVKNGKIRITFEIMQQDFPTETMGIALTSLKLNTQKSD